MGSIMKPDTPQMEAPEYQDIAVPTREPELVTMEIVRSENEFAALSQSWERLTQLSKARIYQTFDWQWTWWSHFGSGLDLHIIALRHNGEIIGLAPFCVETGSVWGVPYRRCLKLVGCNIRIKEPSGIPVTYDVSDYLDIIIHPGYIGPALESIAQYLRDHLSEYDAIEFTNVPDESLIMKALVPRLKESGFRILASRADVCPRLKVPSSIEAYLQSLGPNVRRRLLQAKTAANGGGLFTIERAEGPALWPGSVRELAALHQQRWNRIGYPGLFYDARFGRFINDVVGRMQGRGRVWLKIATSGGKTVAVRLGFCFNDAFYDYLSGFDDQSPAAKRRPGIALLLSMIEDARGLNAETVDFLRGDEAYKFEMSSEAAHNWKVTAFLPAHASIPRAILSFVDGGIRWWWKERLLMRVQSQQYPFPSSVMRYFRFRTESVARKIGRAAGRGPGFKSEKLNVHA